MSTQTLANPWKETRHTTDVQTLVCSQTRGTTVSLARTTKTLAAYWYATDTLNTALAVMAELRILIVVSAAPHGIDIEISVWQ